MRVIRIIARLNVGGPARHVVWLSAALREAGHETVLVTGVVPPGEEEMSYFAAAHGVEPIVIPEMSREIAPRDVITVWKLYQLFRRLRPDVVHTHTAKAGTVGRVAGLLYRWLTPSALWGRGRPCRFVHTYHGHIFHGYYGPAKTRLFLMIERALARLATDRIIVISQQQRREIHETYGVGRREQVATIPLGLDLEIFAGAARRRHLLRDELGAGADEVLVGIVGRLTEIKNHQLFLEAVARLLKDGRAGGARFLVIGDGHLRDELEREAERLGLNGRLSFLGTRADPENFYPALDLVALTSRNEGTPLTLIEAMACARPVVATAVGGVVDLLGEAAGAETVVPGVTVCERGVAVRPGDAVGFSRGMARLIEDKALREQLGERGRKYVGEHYTKERLVADITGLYEELFAPRLAAGAGERTEIPVSSGQRY